MAFEVLPNIGADAIHGAGLQTAQLVANKGVEIVITGNIGPNAYQALSAAGIKVITGATGTVREVVERYRLGQLQENASVSNVPAHFGTNAREGMGWRYRMRRGGAEASSEIGHQPTHPEPTLRWQSPASGIHEPLHYQPSVTFEHLSPEDEIVALEERKKRLGEELRGLQARIKELRDMVQRRDIKNS
jgi:predicted Fe-Mo cluster-binding NifX family protein